MKKHISAYAVVDDDDPAAVTRVIEVMSRTVAGYVLDGYESGLTVADWGDDDGGEGVVPEPSNEPAES